MIYRDRDNQDEAVPQEQAPLEGEASRELDSTLENLKQAIARIEDIAAQLETGEITWDESLELLAEVNQKATSCSQELEQVVQDIIYRSPDDLPGSGGEEV